jgi:hypothetical protein
VGSGEVDTGAASEGPIRRMTGTEALKAHVTLAVGLLLCAVAFSFEIRRALGGNALSWAYVFEWPLLGAFAVYMWWNVIHPERLVKRMSKKKVPIAPEFDGMLAAWQQHRDELSRAQVTPAPSERDPR